MTYNRAVQFLSGVVIVILVACPVTDVALESSYISCLLVFIYSWCNFAMNPQLRLLVGWSVCYDF